MQNQNLPLSKISRETYNVPKGEEQVVHYKAERVLFSGANRVSHPDLIKTNVKAFDEVKRNLELQGYTIEILYHPLGKYTTTRIPRDASEEIAEKEAEIKAKDAMIAELEAKAKALAAELDAKAKEVSAEKKESAKDETPTEITEEKEKSTEKKAGRPKKEDK